MMHYTGSRPSLFLVAIIGTLLSACGGAPAPQPSGENPTAAATASAAPATGLAATQLPALTQPPAAAPTLPPTATSQSHTPAPPTAAPQTDTATPPPFTRTLSLQNPPIAGADVQAAQARLLALGYAQVGPADGIFGPNTQAALRTFQAFNQLEVDGILGPRSWERLFGPDAIPGAAVVPIVDGDTGWLLGGASGQRWLDGPTTAALLRGGEQYRRVGRTGQLGAATGSRADSLGIPCEPTFRVELTPQPAVSQTLTLGGSWDAVPRALAEESVETSAYRQLVGDQLRASGIAAPDVRLTRAVRVDLDGDGTEELLIAATRLGGEGDFPAPSVTAGDYSLVIVRASVAGVERTIELEAEYYPKAQEFAAPNRHTLLAIADLNGDGRLEIVVDSKYYEGQSIVAYSLAGGKAEEVLSVGCGV